MQNLSRKFVICAPLRTAAKPPFPEIQFIRLTAWQSSKSHVNLVGGASFDGRIFWRYHHVSKSDVLLDFCCRGSSLSDTTAKSIDRALAYNHFLDFDELLQIEEIFNEQLRDDCSRLNNIEHAEVGIIDGKPVLANRWTNVKDNRKCISMYFKAVGTPTVREVHFSAPFALFDNTTKDFSDVVRSIQWIDESVPYFEIVS